MIRAVLSIFLVACLVLTVSPWVIAGEDPASAADAGKISLSLPGANMELDNLVPLSIVKKITLNKAKELWGQVTPGEPIVCCDQDGDIVTYMCPFHIGKGPFPSYEQIMRGVREGRRLVEEAEKGFPSQELAGEQSADDGSLEERSCETDAEMDTPSAPYPAESELSVGTAPTPPEKPEGASFREALKKAKEKELGIGEYGTIYVSARYDRYPIPLCSHYLCPYYTTGDLAQEKANKALGGTPTLARYYFLGYRGQYFEFVSGERKVSIHAYSLEIEPIKEIEQAVPTEEQLDDIWQDWIEVTGTNETVKGGE
jgi:hypothetical protein